MEENLRARIYNNLNLKETEELQEIWQNRDTNEWDENVFPIIYEILEKRLGVAPSQSIQAQVRQALSDVDDYLQNGKLEQALKACERAIQMMPDHPRAYYYRGQIREALGQLNSAIADYQKAIQLDPEFKSVWRKMLSVEKELEEEFQRSSAKQYLDQALENLYNNEPGKMQEEIDLAKGTLPGIAIAHNYLGLVLQASGQLESAIDAYLEAIQLNPRFYAARENLRNARVRLEEEQYCQTALEEADAEIDFDESQASEISMSDDPAPGWLYLDECAFLLSGWPGHRTRPGRSGYDPLNTNFENAHMGGVMIRSLFTRKFRTRLPFYLFLMAYSGLMFCLPLLFFGVSLLLGDGSVVGVLIVLSPYWVIGIALLINVYLSLLLEKSDAYDEDGYTFF